MWLGVKLFLIVYLSNAIQCAKLFNQDVEELKQNLFLNKVSNADLKGLNRVLIKRTVPHDSEPGRFEFNKELNYLYRPLARFRVRKPVNDVSLSKNQQQDVQVLDASEIKEFLNNLGNAQRGIDGKYDRLKKKQDYGEGVSELLELLGDGNDRDANSDQRLYSERNKKRNSDVKYLLKLLQGDDRDYSKKNRYHRVLLDIPYSEKYKNKKESWNKLGRKLKTASEKDFYKSLIDKLTQALRLGDKKIQHNIFEVKEDTTHSMTEKPKMELPHYPYWNWWTYKKTVYHDNCKHGWVKFHNMCYELPPH